MKVVINTAHQRFGGAIQVALSFINECMHFPEHEYHVWVGPGVAKSIDISVFPKNFYFYFFDFGVINFSVIRSIQKTLKPVEDKIKPDVLIASSGPTYYQTNRPQIIGFNLPLYIYPESPFLKNLNRKQKIKLWLKKQVHFYFFKRDATAYVVQTEDVNKRVRKALHAKNVYTVTNNHSAVYLNKSSFVKNKLPEKKANEFRLLTVTSYYGHKNLELIPQIIELLKQRGYHNVIFVLTLKSEDYHNHIQNADKIMNVGPLKPNDCPSLYQECDAMFLPTLAECFSASYPEAMIMKKPIITTDLGFARSICGNAALYFEPMNASDAAEKIIALIINKELQQNLIMEGSNELQKFDTPKERARKYLEICKQHLQK